MSARVPVIAVLACCHQARDEWVDDRARAEAVNLGGCLPIDDASYQGVWLTPERPGVRVHLFARPDDVATATENGWRRAPMVEDEQPEVEELPAPEPRDPRTRRPYGADATPPMRTAAHDVPDVR